MRSRRAFSVFSAFSSVSLALKPTSSNAVLFVARVSARESIRYCCCKIFRYETSTSLDALAYFFSALNALSLTALSCSRAFIAIVSCFICSIWRFSWAIVTRSDIAIDFWRCCPCFVSQMILEIVNKFNKKEG